MSSNIFAVLLQAGSVKTISLSNDIDVQLAGLSSYCLLQLSYNKKGITKLLINYQESESVKIEEEITDPAIFEALTLSVLGIGDNLWNKISSYVSTLADDDLAIIKREYENQDIINWGFNLGLASYLALISLNDNNSLLNDIPFQFNIPYTIHSGNAINRNMFRYLSLPLTALQYSASDLMKQLVNSVQTFINIWEPLFQAGPSFSVQTETRLCVDIISGLANQVVQNINSKSLTNLQQLEILKNSLKDEVKSQFSNYQGTIDNTCQNVAQQNMEKVINTCFDKCMQKIRLENLNNVEDQTKKIVRVALDNYHDKIKIQIQRSITEEIERLVSSKMQNELTTTIDKSVVTALEYQSQGIVATKVDQELNTKIQDKVQSLIADNNQELTGGLLAKIDSLSSKIDTLLEDRINFRMKSVLDRLHQLEDSLNKDLKTSDTSLKDSTISSSSSSEKPLNAISSNFSAFSVKADGDFETQASEISGLSFDGQ